jgi:hypothetical protein
MHQVCGSCSAAAAAAAAAREDDAINAYKYTVLIFYIADLTPPASALLPRLKDASLAVYGMIIAPARRSHSPPTQPPQAPATTRLSPLI